MVFFFLVPSIPATLGNFFLPMMIGARDLAFPPNQSSELVSAGDRRPVRSVSPCWRAAWILAGHSTHPTAPPIPIRWVIATALGIFIAGFSSILTGLNFIVTVHRMRAPGHDVVSNAAVRVVQLRHRVDSGARYAGARRHLWCWSSASASSTSGSSTRARRRPGPLPASLLVLLASRSLHHGTARGWA